MDASPDAGLDARQTSAQQERARQEDDGRQDGGTGEARPAGAGWLRSISKIVIPYIAVPLVEYSLLRAAGLSPVTALLLSGVLPAVGVAIGVIRRRRLDVAAALILAGIVVGTVLGLISHSARPALIEGSVPTGVFGISCLGSLWASRPLMFGLAQEFAGPDTAQGREMTRLWQFEGYRYVFRIITAVWGAAFLIEAAARVVIVYSTSAGTALAISKVMPWVWVGALSAWTVGYGRYHRKKSERMMAAAGEAPPWLAGGHDRADASGK